jgi:hypothetical protein
MIRFSHSQTFKYQYFPVTKGANLSNVEFFDAVAHIETGLAQFSNAFGQRG